MNDDELTGALADAMRASTADDAPSAAWIQTVVRTRVSGARRPYLVPIGATAVVTALTAGGFVLSNQQNRPAAPAAGDTVTPTAAPTTAAAPPSTPPAVRPSSPAAPVVVTATPSAPPTTSGLPQPAAPTAAPTTTSVATAEPTTPPTTATSVPAPTTTATVPAPISSDDSALFAQAASYSVTEKTIVDPTLPDSSTTTKTVTLTHNGAKVYYANQLELAWDDLATLPTETEAFRAAVMEPGHPPNAVEKGLQELLQNESPLPLPQRRAAMEVAMTMPGATVTKTKDADARQAVKVSIETAWMADDYYFDPVSFRLLEASSFVTPEYVAHWTPVNKAAGNPASPLGSGYLVLYSDWTLTPKS